jgi:outer membrane biosynthesis protein TonB
MWKLLRNLLLAAILLAGALKLLAWYEAGQDAQRATEALAPYAQVRYDGLSAGLDGSVNLSGVSVAIKRGATQDMYRADSVVLESPSVFWLIKHALLAENDVPPRFGISVQGLKLPARAWLDPLWLNPANLVPFETLGCGEGTFTSADYSKMGVAIGATRQHLEYRYDAETKLLDLSLTLTAPAFANVSLDAELHPFDPKAGVALDKLHIDQLSATYADNGYLQRRNQFCAQRENLGPKQFVEQHVAAAQALLAQHRIQPGNELVKLYRNLVENGGRASILSLPSSNFVAGAWRSNPPEDVLRQLNVTTRYGDSPPVMFRLSFLPPAEVEAPALAADTATPDPAVAAAVAPAIPPPPPAPAPAVPAPTATPVVTAAPPPVSTAPRVTPVPAPPPVAVASVPPVPVVPPVAAPTHAPASNLGLQNLDRAEALLPPPPAKPSKSPDTPEFLPSQPRPAGDQSTLALVWKPTIERLGAAPPEQHNYDVIDYARLKDALGRHVRLITDGGKKLEGDVVSADDSGVALRMTGRVGGDLEYVIPKARIQQIQLFHRPSPPA